MVIRRCYSLILVGALDNDSSNLSELGSLRRVIEPPFNGIDGGIDRDRVKSKCYCAIEEGFRYLVECSIHKR